MTKRTKRLAIFYLILLFIIPEVSAASDTASHTVVVEVIHSNEIFLDGNSIVSWTNNPEAKVIVSNGQAEAMDYNPGDEKQSLHKGSKGAVYTLSFR